ncbi:alpha/beta fold hydrolase [Flavitalea sp.]|nr:alpha/beta hydrolase [Flavitalea sp.]
MQFRFLLNLIIFSLLADNITNAQEFRSFEISGYPEFNEIIPDRSPFSSPAPIVGKIKLHTGVTLEYSESGNPNGKPVIFLHGFTDSRHSFNYLVPKLTGDIRSIVITQRGHGQSDKPVSGYRPENFAADLDAFMTARNLDKAIIVGHSLGSTIAQSFAIQYPSKVRGLVLLGTIPYFKTNPALLEFGSQVALLKDPVDHAFASDFQKSTLHLPIPETYLDSVINETLKVPSLVWKAVLNGLTEVDYSTSLKNINAPVLIIYGDKDNFSSIRDQEKLRSSIRGSHLLVYKGVGHAIHWEDPSQTAIDVSAFVNDIDKT